MSNALSIAAVTTTLRFLLQQRFDIEGGGTIVTTKPLDKARDSSISNGNQVNLFLYHTQIHPGWRNMDLPDQVKPGETGQPLLPLNLYYLLTTFSQNDDYPDPTSHRLLGLAMRVLHDHSVLTPADVKAALPANQDYDLDQQIEQMRIVYQPLTVEESFNLWSNFQAPYRVSVAYEVAPVLIESGLTTKTPLPVIRRQTDNSGPILRPDLLSFLPTLLTVQLPNQEASARLGDVLVLNGYNLDAESLVILFTNNRREITVEITSQLERTATNIRVQLPDDGAQFVAGFYTVAVIVTRTGEQTRTSNELPFSLAPRILEIIPRRAERNVNGEVMLTLVCSPQVQPEQRVALLLGDREIIAQPRTTVTDRLEFQIGGVTTGEYFVRLRIDGVDSLLVDRTVTPPAFDQNQKVTIL